MHASVFAELTKTERIWDWCCVGLSNRSQQSSYKDECSTPDTYMYATRRSHSSMALWCMTASLLKYLRYHKYRSRRLQFAYYWWNHIPFSWLSNYMYIPSAHENHARVSRHFLPYASDVIHPGLQKWKGHVFNLLHGTGSFHFKILLMVKQCFNVDR